MDLFERIKRKIITLYVKIWSIFNKNIVKEDSCLAEIPKFVYKNRVRIGRRCYINEEVFFHAVAGITIGDDVVISRGTKIYTTGLDPQSFLKRQSKHNYKTVIIGNNVWIGAESLILPGVTIADNVIVAAGSVVTKNLTEEKCLYGGNPARKIKSYK